jgi:carotenoid cleavage dioxygenase
MAHIFDIPAYVDGKRASSQTVFPSGEVFHGFNTPCRFEGQVFDLEVRGIIPAEIDGTFYRVSPDHRFPPMYEDDIHFNGGSPLIWLIVDGNVSAFRIHNGHVDFQQKYVKTDRYVTETKYRRNLFGKYRNPFTGMTLFFVINSRRPNCPRNSSHCFQYKHHIPSWRSSRRQRRWPTIRYGP